MSPRISTLWNDEENARLLAACADHVKLSEQGWKDIALQMPGRTWMACRQQRRLLLRKARGIEATPRKQRARKSNGRIDNRPAMQEPLAPHQMPRHASQAAAMLGDPPLGRSALDQMRAGLV